MNYEQEMTPAAEQQDPAPEVEEIAPEEGEISEQAEAGEAAEQEPATEAENGAEAENQPETPPNGEAVEDEDGYDDFYHDMSDFEQETPAEEGDDGGDTPSDPEGEDADEGENQAEEQPPVEEYEQEAEQEESSSETDPADVDYAAWEREDREAILAAHPELKATLEGKHLRDVLDDPGLFGYMRGSAENRAKYSAVDAFEKASAQLLAKRAADARAKQSSKQHIRSGSTKAATPPSSIPADMMRQLKDMFPGKTRDELLRLYNTVT